MLIPLIIPVSEVMLLLVLLTLSARAAADAAHEKLASCRSVMIPFRRRSTVSSALLKAE